MADPGLFEDKPKENATPVSRSSDEVALEMMKFIAVTTGYCKTPQSGAGFLIAATTNVGMVGKQIKAIREKFHKSVGYLKAVAPFRQADPNVVQIGFGFRSNATCHQLLAACSAASLARPRSFTTSASSRMDSWVITRPKP